MKFYSVVFLFMLNIYSFECQKNKLYKDISTLYMVNGEKVYIEAYHSLEDRKILKDKDYENYRLLEWHSIGYPVIVENESKIKSFNKSLFHFTQKTFYTSVQMLTNDQKILIAQEIKKVHNICIDIKQISELKLSKFECEIELYGNSEDDIRGSIRSFKTDSLRLEFKHGNDSKEQKLFKDYLSERISDVKFFCEISSNKFGYENSHFKLMIQLIKPVSILY
jgi:hypothetical protein